jgi:chromosome segregation ATPase
MTAQAQHHEPSDADLAARLEQYEIDQLREQLRQQRIAHTEELSAAKREAEQDPLERMIDRWNGYPAAIERARYAEAELAKARAEHASVTDTLNVVADNCAKFEQLADHYKDQCEKMLAKSNDNVERANDTIGRLQQQVRELNTQLRIYREMNPDKLKKQVKRLQDKNKELTARNETAVKNAEQVKKEKAQLAQELHATRQMNRDLKDSLDDMEKIAEGTLDANECRYAYKDETWGITGHDRNTQDLIFIEHLPTGQRRVLSRASGDIMRTEPIPAPIKALAQQWVEKYAQLHDAIDNLCEPATNEKEAS